MSNKSRRRRVMAVGTFLAGAAIPIAAAGTAWADIEVSYDGHTVINTFPTGDNPAVSGTNNDLAVYSGPAADGTTVNAKDNVGDTNDVAYASNSNTSQPVSNATITNAQNSTATATNGGNAQVTGNTVGGVTTNDAATANGPGATAGVVNTSTGTAAFDKASADSGTSSTPTAAAVDNIGTGKVTFDSASATAGSNGQTTVAAVAGENSGNTTLDAAKASNGGLAIIANGGTSDMTGDTANASGVNSTPGYHNGLGTNHSVAIIGNATAFGNTNQPVSFDSATASNGGLAEIVNGGDSKVPVIFDTVNGNNGSAATADAGSSSTTALNTGSANVISVNGGNGNAYDAGASVSYATNSSALAENPGSQAVVTGTPTDYIFNSHAVDTTGPAGASIVNTSNDPIINGVETGGAAVSAPVPVHAVPPSAPLMVPMHMPLLP
ncbi:beta strand repeat-containing protein [uncultured Mycobacterium sp.]|uniref:beta strand repeat-containing protein n=1 Tax=uncultured Mycobacterium sp. TaxID=171292 RepID=UPI0035CB1E22